ncbi:MAG: DUF4402 domain-containing protein [Chitinophagaceae bacterium]|nr:MAG: DUF4402 domain-containing protein [Chitinophagaceae bacterium]
MMKKTQKVLGAAVAMLLFTANVNAQATATANASATIVSPISISKTTDMNFGNISVDASGGIVILEASAAGNRGAAGAGGVSFPSNTGIVSAATFVVSGQPNFAYSINIVNNSILISNGNADMTVDNFTKNILTGLLDNLGTQTVYVGADLTVNGSQEPGVYTSTSPFTVIVDYN